MDLAIWESAMLRELSVSGFIEEVETLPSMNFNPEMGKAVTSAET